MAQLDRCLWVDGTVETDEDIIINARIEGLICSESHAVIVGSEGIVVGNVIAREITVFGTVSGTLVATGRVDIRATARVTGRVVATRLILEEDGWFVGSVLPQPRPAADDVQVAAPKTLTQAAGLGLTQ